MGFATFVFGLNSDLRRVSWPTRSVVVNHTIVVLVTLVALTGFIAGFDYVSGEGVRQLLRSGS